MIVYLVFELDRDARVLMAVFSTRTKAEQFVTSVSWRAAEGYDIVSMLVDVS